MRRRFTFCFPALFAVLAVGCPTTPSDDDDACSQVCEPGETQECLCATDVHGAQTCAEDGCGWSDC